MPEQAWRIELLGREHDREACETDVPALDDYLRRFARQNDEKGIGRTYVAVREDAPARIRGWYTLRTGAVAFASLPRDHARRLPRYPVPVVHLARLGVDVTERGRGLGEALLVHALQRALRVAEVVGVRAVEAIAKDERARGFYLRYGFVALLDDPLHLYLSIEAIRRAAAG